MNVSERAYWERTRFDDYEPLGVIDIGSNSVRLVIYEGAVRSPTTLFNEKVLCGLGRAVASSGLLGAESVERAIQALARFRAIARIMRVKNLRAIATAAVREARDGADFIMRAEKAAGVPIEVLSGAEEADLAAKGIFMGFREPDGFAGDLGGGSLEITDITPKRIKDATTLPLGGLRLIDASGGRLEKALDIADRAVAGISWLSRGEGRSFYAVGGTWRSLARLHMEQASYPLRMMHGYVIPLREAIDFCESVRRAKRMGDLDGIDVISKPRREVLPYGALVMERLLRKLKPSEVVFSVFGIREGLLFKLLSATERARDPLISFCEDAAKLRSRSAEHAAELCQWTDALFAGPGPDESADERRLRHAACLLSDVGWRAHPDYRGEQSLNLIAHSALAGVDHPGRIFLALSIYFRHTGLGKDEPERDELSNRLKALVSRRALKRARIVGAAVRTAHMLSVGMPGVVDETPVSYEGSRLVLTLPRVHATLNGERLQRRLEVLARLLDRESEIRIGR